METNFITKQKPDNQRLIYFSFAANGRKILISTSLQIKDSNWGKGYPKKTNSTKEIRSQLDSWKIQIDELIKDIVKKEQRQPTKFELTDFINHIQGKKQTTSNTIKQLIEDYLSYSKKYAKKTQQTKAIHLKELSSYLNGKEVNDLSSKAIKAYQKNVDGLQLELSTLNDYIKDAKAFFKWLHESELANENYGVYLKKHKLIDKSVIAITDDEFLVLENSELKERLQRVVDLFIFGCYTGLRYSDIQRVDRDMINENNELQFRIQKTSEIIRIPLINEAIQLLEKYNYQLPAISNQKANDYIKEAFTALKLNRKVNISTQHIDGIQDEIKPLNEVISFHKARKSFITIALLRGVPSYVVKKLSGHKSEVVFQKYVAYTDEILTTQMNKMSRSARHLQAV